MERPEFMFLTKNVIPPHIYNTYKLQHIIHNNKINIHINIGMYGLPQAGKLSHNQLVNKLEPYGYHPCTHNSGLWNYSWRPIMFTLVVDDFVIKYIGKEHEDHLINALREQYSDIVTDWKGLRYCGMNLQWNYQQHHVDISITDYIKKHWYIFNTPNQVNHNTHHSITS